MNLLISFTKKVFNEQERGFAHILVVLLLLLGLVAGVYLVKQKQFTDLFASTTSTFSVDTGNTLPQGLIAYYKLDEASGSAIIDNAASLDGTATGTTIAPGISGESRVFDSTTNSRLDIGDNSAFEKNNLTISVWVYRTGECNPFFVCGIVSKGESGFTGYSLDLRKTSGNYYPGFSVKDGTQRVTGTTIIQPDTWYHLSASIDGSRMKLYVNGVLEADQSQSAVPTFGGEHFKIGTANTNNDLTMNGRVDEVGVWSRALTQTEISDLYNGGLGNTCTDPCSTPPAPSPSPSPVTTLPSAPQFNNNPVTKKVLFVIYDPILASGQKLHQARGWGDPNILINQVNSSLNQNSGGYLTYQIVENSERNEFPQQIGGVRATEQTYNNCMNSSNREVDCAAIINNMDYNKMWTDLNICSKVSNGAIDEVIIYGAPYFGFDEYAFKIPGDNLPNPTSNYWFYEGRKKNIPDCNGKTVFVMGYSYERGVAEAVHSFSHRVENAVGLTVGRGNWQSCSGTTAFDKFTCHSTEINQNTPQTVSGCGNVHFPPNGLQDYDYGSTSSVPSICTQFATYPNIGTTTQSTSCSTWGCTGDSQLSYLNWWLSNLPRQADRTSDNNIRNWWKYVADFDKAILEAQTTAPSPIPSPSPSPSPTPTPTPSPSATPSASPTNGLSAPTNLSAVSINKTQIQLKWTDTNTAESGYAIERSLSPSSGFAQVNLTRSNKTSWTNGGLKTKTTYYFRVRAKGTNNTYSAYSSVVSATTN